MVATIIDDLRQYFNQDADVVVAYLYCNYNRQSEQDLHQILATIVRQLFQERTLIPDAVTKLYVRHRDRQTRPSIDELKSLLQILVQLHRQVFILVDALDECSIRGRCRDLFLDELFLLQAQTKASVNILATTRFVPDIVDCFSTHPRLEIRAHREDIERYLDTRMPEIACARQRPKLQGQIKAKITDSVDGM